MRIETVINTALIRAAARPVLWATAIIR